MMPDPSSFLGTVFVLWAMHFLADFPLQGPYMSQAKNFKLPESDASWLPIMFGHCMIHAVMVWFVTSSFWLAWFMLVMHFLIDVLKCSGFFGHGAKSFYLDQFFHFVVILWIAALYCCVFWS